MWTESDRELVRQHYQEMGAKWCAARIGKSRAWVHLAAQILGVSSPKHDLKGREAEFAELHRAGYTRSEIADEMGVAWSTVARATKARGWEANKPFPRAAESLAKVKNLHKKGLNDRQIARLTGMSRGYVFHVRKNKLRLKANPPDKWKRFDRAGLKEAG